MMLRAALFILLSASLGCGLSSWVDKPALTTISIRNSISGTAGNFAAGLNAGLAACPGTKVYLFMLDDQGRKVEPAVAVTDVNSGKFSFTNLPGAAWTLTNAGVTQPLLLQVVGCGELNARLVTSSENQTVDESSTLLTFALHTTQATRVIANHKSSRGAAFAAVHQTITADASPALALARLQSSSSALYTNYAGGSAAELNSAPPLYLIEELPSVMHETQAATFKAQFKHWDSAYTPHAAWKKDALVLGSGDTYIFTPGKNDQGQADYAMLLGADDGGGGLDGGRPIVEVSFAITTANDFPPVVPPTTLASAALTRNPNVSLQMDTGAGFVNCATFSKIAITENDPAPPAPTVFDTQNRLCTTAIHQNFTHTLVSSSNGAKFLRVWTMDAAGNVSVVPVLITVTFDTSAPALAFSTPAANTEFNSPLAITGSCESGFDVDVAGTGASAPQTVSCAGGTFSATVTPTAGQGTKTITLSQTDGVGNLTTVTRDFVFDSIAPIVTITGPSAHTAAQTGVTLTGACESGLTVNLSGTGLASPSTTTCTSGAYSQAVVFTAGEGVKNIIVTQTDAAGNVGTANRDFDRDNTAPTLTIVSPAAASAHRGSLTVNGTCETGGSTITISGDISAPTSATCSAGAFSIALTLSAGDGTKAIAFAQNDAAGNTGNASLSVVNDNTAPTLLILTPAASARAQTGVTLTGTCEAGLTVNLSGAGLASPSTATCSSGSFSQAIVFTAGEGTKNIVVSQTDSAGNVGTTNRSFERDNTVPALAFSTPSANTVAQTGLTITGTCETGLTIALSGTGLDSPSTTACAAGSFSQAIVFTAGDGTKNIVLSQTDEAGNVGTTQRDFLKDDTDPILTITAPATNTSAQSSVTMTGACETGLSITFGGTGLLSGFSVSCAGASYSQAVFFSAGDGTKNITVTQTDAAGNTTSVARDFIRDNVAPALTQTTLAFPHYSKNNQVTFGGACETGLTVNVDIGGSPEGTAACAAGTWTYTTAAQGTDGTYNYAFKQTDAAGNLASTAGRYIRDNVAPSLAITSTVSWLTASNAVTFSGTCENGLPSPIAVGGADAATTTCSAGAWSYTTATQTTDGTRNYTFTLTDQAGNATTVNGTWERNTNVPNLLLTTSSPLINALNAATVNGNCETGLDVEIRLGGSLENTVSCPGGTFSYTFATQMTDAARAYEFKQTNALSLSTTANFTWTRDTAPPTLTAGHFNINNDATDTASARVQIDLRASDSLTKITHFCLKAEDNTAPLAADPCWIAVNAPTPGLTPASTLDLVDYGYNLPITPDTYTVYAWVHDEAGNISALTAAGTGTTLTDKDSINLIEVIAPTVDQVIIGSNDAPASPPSSADLTVGAGSPLYIKWRATDDVALPASPISIYFTTDDVNYSLVASGLLNGQNGSCQVNNPGTSADDLATGCYRWSAVPSAAYMRVRVVATDSVGLTSGQTSNALNVSSNIRFLVGNTDPRLNLSAKGTLFQVRNQNYWHKGDGNAFVVTRDGVVYVKDYKQGLIKIDPADGISRVYLPQTGTSTGDNGPAANATARELLRISLDTAQPKENLYLQDYDRIRKINLSTGLITTIVGGGSDISDTVANPLDAKVVFTADRNHWWQPNGEMFSLPNGDLYFQDGESDARRDSGARLAYAPYRYRYLEASSGQIKSLKITSVPTTANITNADDCELRDAAFTFDPATSVIGERIVTIRGWPGWSYCNSYGDHGDFARVDATGVGLASYPPPVVPGHTLMDEVTISTARTGDIYSLQKRSGANGIYKYSPLPAGTWTRILGSSDRSEGDCADNTDATSCHTTVSDMFVAENGQVFFMDAGRIRAIKPNGKVTTLYGDSYLSPSHTPALEARLGSGPNYLQIRNNGALLFGDPGSNTILEADPSGSFYRIAGTGTLGIPTMGLDSLTQPVQLEHPNATGDSMAVDPITGDIYRSNGDWYIQKLTRNSSAIGSTGVWSRWLGGGGTNWLSADGSSDVHFSLDCGVGHDAGVFRTPSCWNLPMPMGIGGGKLYTSRGDLSYRISNGAALPRNSMVKLYDLTTQTQSHLVGKIGIFTTADVNNAYDPICAPGTPLANCEFFSPDWVYRRAQPLFDSVGGRWITSGPVDGSIYGLPPGGNLQIVTTLTYRPRGFAYKRSGANEYVYYCGDGQGGLRRRHVQSNTEIALAWPIAGLKCSGYAMVPTPNGVGFIYELNGLTGIAEYLDSI